MKAQKKQPELRFKGFTDDWEQSKLGNLVEIKDSARISNIYWQEDGIPYLRSSDLVDYTASGALFISKQTYNTFSSKTGSPKKGDVLFTSGGTIGIPTLKKDDSLIYVQGGSILYAKTSNSVKLDGRFLVNYFYNSRIKIYIKNSSVGGTIKHFTLMPAKKMPIIFPKKKEQQKIGEFFRKLDRTITLQQRKLELFKKLKQGYLQQMFPSKDQYIPRLRFKEFNGDWEQVKLGNIFEKKNELNRNQFTENRTISIATMTFKPSGNGADENSIPKYKVLRLGDIAFEGHKNKDFAFGRFLMNDIGDGIISPRFTFLHAKEKLDIDFWKYYIHHESIMRTILVKSTKQGTMMNELVVTDFLKQGIKVPEKSEQKIIGIFLTRLDHTITLQQNEIEQLQQLKQAYLQKLFP
ncbi:restriction endonuclease subunit S [Latilactobacillus sakei]|uniref:restriction endonuclease subunit S n=1 Tax=Latilactobacillus sakei TaxID=1599 RepID=UPI000C12884F|nr:restriction endonuclease subunit S [Latilactobacillus sakei]PKX61709.1 restriction endonuclease subunit S [Latilactobacillus sakei]PKX69450.1 restriction endonuclease subunit S [Latilactobacillus sakei]RFN57556.1 restriction endonuclease subunit S [Latilactobacillus sakei]UNC16668.1 restriction endonuclease subunit S [Latilactobacillus sakei]SON69563.1 Type I restriction modification DNA specificity domain protein [Latilactobacillus sakei]